MADPKGAGDGRPSWSLGPISFISMQFLAKNLPLNASSLFDCTLTTCSLQLDLPISGKSYSFTVIHHTPVSENNDLAAPVRQLPKAFVVEVSIWRQI